MGGLGDEFHWRATFFYGFSEERERHKSWALLQQLYLNSSLPWFCAGDFNEVLVTEEHEGGDLRSNRQMESFRNALGNFHLIDIGFIGHKFTWETRE